MPSYTEGAEYAEGSVELVSESELLGEGTLMFRPKSMSSSLSSVWVVDPDNWLTFRPKRMSSSLSSACVVDILLKLRSKTGLSSSKNSTAYAMSLSLSVSEFSSVSDNLFDSQVDVSSSVGAGVRELLVLIDRLLHDLEVLICLSLIDVLLVESLSSYHSGPAISWRSEELVVYSEKSSIVSSSVASSVVTELSDSKPVKLWICVVSQPVSANDCHR